jgi:hypothetical protein
MIDFSPNSDSQEKALKQAINAYYNFKPQVNGIQNTEKMIVVNMTEPSYRKRFYLYNFLTQQIEREHHCAHGIASSDPHNPAKAVYFSNTPKSRKSSLGAMYTGEIYHGKHGKSLRLFGLEKGINDNVYRRSIVIHGAYYCENKYIREAGRCGRSFGCFALDPAITSEVIEESKEGMFLYCYGE